jgi:hypothetical protein
VSKLTERQIAFLRALQDNPKECDRGVYAGRLAHLAGFGGPGRVDAGATATLDSLERRGLVDGSYPLPVGIGDLIVRATARRWTITQAGRDALGEYAFGE